MTTPTISEKSSNEYLYMCCKGVGSIEQVGNAEKYMQYLADDFKADFTLFGFWVYHSRMHMESRRDPIFITRCAEETVKFLEAWPPAGALNLTDDSPTVINEDDAEYIKGVVIGAKMTAAQRCHLYAFLELQEKVEAVQSAREDVDTLATELSHAQEAYDEGETALETARDELSEEREEYDNACKAYKHYASTLMQSQPYVDIDPHTARQISSSLTIAESVPYR